MSATPTILVVDDSTLCRDMVIKSLQEHGLKTVAATDGTDGLSRLGQQHVDAVILDNEMPRMGGLPFLKALRADPQWTHLPVLMLTTTVAKDVIMQATKYGLSGYILKAKLSMPDLVTRINQALARAVVPNRKPKPPSLDKLTVPTLGSRDATVEAISQLATAGTLPGIAAKVASIAQAAKPSIPEMAAVVKQDPALAIRVVQLATSQNHGGAKNWHGSIEEAVRTIGVPAVREISGSMPVLKSFPADKADGAGLLRCWQHSLAVAAIMGRIVPKTDEIPAGLPYLVGLCHDLVELVLRQRFPGEFAAAADYAKQAEVPAVELVRHIFGIAHSELVEAVFDSMKLPEIVSGPIKEFAFSAHGNIDAHSMIITRSLSIANFLANGILCMSSPDSPVAPLLQTDCRTALISTNAINLSEIASETMLTVRQLANVSDQEKAVTRPLLLRRDVSVWYFRHSNFAALDPLEAALRSLCKVEVKDRLPTVEETAAVGGIIFTSPNTLAGLNELSRAFLQRSKRSAILHIVRTPADVDRTIPGVEVLQYPTALTRLAHFISQLPT